MVKGQSEEGGRKAPTAIRSYARTWLAVEKCSQLFLHVVSQSVSEADGRWGLAKKGPFDVIHVGAAPKVVPEELKQQLKVGGRLVIPVGPAGNQALVAIDRKSEKEFVQSHVCGVMYVPLTSAKDQLKSY